MIPRCILFASRSLALYLPSPSRLFAEEEFAVGSLSILSASHGDQRGQGGEIFFDVPVMSAEVQACDLGRSEGAATGDRKPDAAE
jgi:hypothetical protein